MTERSEGDLDSGRVPTMAALIGSWRTEGEVLGEDGQSVIGTLTGTDVYEALGPNVVHHVDIHISGERTRALEIFEPYDAARGGFPARAYDDRGGVETSTAVVDNGGVWTFGSSSASATLHVAEDGASMRARWQMQGPSGRRRPWMDLRFTRVVSTGRS